MQHAGNDIQEMKTIKCLFYTVTMSDIILLHFPESGISLHCAKLKNRMIMIKIIQRYDKWSLKLNVKKCKHMSIAVKSEHQSSYGHTIC